MCKVKGLAIGRFLQKNIGLIVPEVKIQQKVYRQIKYEDTSYKIRIYEDCRSISLKDLKKVYHKSAYKNLTYNLKKQNQSLPFSPFFLNQLPKQEKEERNILRKKQKIENAGKIKNLSLESETISELLENDLGQRDEEDLEEFDSIFPLKKQESQAECRSKYKLNITSIIRYLTEKQPNPSEIQQIIVKQIPKRIIFQKIKRAIIILVLLANIISIVWKNNCIEYQINT